MRKNIFVLSLLMFFVFPALAHAAVVINEIMYDPPGADSGQEWIELYNNSDSSPVDLTGWTFSDGSNSTKHVFNVPPKNGGVGSMVVQPCGYIIIADNAANTAIQYPNATNIIDSTMSMPDPSASASVTITLFDNQKNPEDTVTYVGGTNADNKGDSLQLANGDWIPAAPTPDEANALVADVSIDTADNNDNSSTATTTDLYTTDDSSSSGGASTWTPAPDALAIDIGPDRTALVEVPLHLTAHVSTRSGAADPSARVDWSFGDGSETEGNAVDKTYNYSGTYLAVAVATDGSVEAQDDFVVTVEPAAVRVAAISGDGITLANDANERLDLSNWRLASGVGSFRIPEGTTLLPNASALFPYSVTNLPRTLNASLAYPDGAIAAQYEPLVHQDDIVVSGAQLSASSSSSNSVQAVEPLAVSAAEPIISTKANIQKNEEAVSAPAAATEVAAAGAALPTAPVVSSTSPKAATSAMSVFHSPWTLGLFGIIAAAGGAFILL